MNVSGPRLMFALVPFFALLLQRAYRREGRRFPGHLYFALHLFSFYFLASVAQRLVGFAGIPWLVTASMWGILALMTAYITFALERVYGTTRRRALRRTVLLLVQFMIGMGAVAYVTLFVMLGLE
jgi:uncharacterized BrkB/YihY/UPF0761 family membrane protein